VARLEVGRAPPEKLERIEQDLHIDVISQCDNTLLLETVRRSQLPLIATHREPSRRFRQEIEDRDMIRRSRDSDRKSMIAGELASAALALEDHIRRSLQPNIDIWRRVGDIPAEMLPGLHDAG
jgi:DNA-binding GntR family transcriptional regulator